MFDKAEMQLSWVLIITFYKRFTVFVSHLISSGRSTKHACTASVTSCNAAPPGIHITPNWISLCEYWLLKDLQRFFFFFLREEKVKRGKEKQIYTENEKTVLNANVIKIK